MKGPISDIGKTLFPNGVVVGVIHAADLKTDLELALLVLSVLYTAVRFALLFKPGRSKREDDDFEPGD